MKRSIIVRYLAGVVLFASSTAFAAEKAQKVDMGRSSFDFAAQLYQRYGAGNTAPNLIFSPASIHLAMTMTSAGAAGNTLKQMETVLALPGGDEAHKSYALLTSALIGEGKRSFGFTLSLSNNLWLQKGYPIQPVFSQMLTNFYRSGVTPLDFVGDPNGSRLAVNDAIAKQTHDKIKDLLAKENVTSMTRLILTNAVYFKAAWAHPFNDDATKPEPFTSLDGKSTDTPMMHTVERMGYFQNDSLQMAELPYEGRELSMLVILPKTDRLADLAKVEQSLSDLPTWTAGLRGKRVNLAMPKFKFESQLALAGDLEAMGMPDAFSGTADFSRITTQEKLLISAVIHKAFIEVNEAGTEAAAATAVAVSAMAMPVEDDPIDFIANHPFLFAIRHNQTGAILFLGRVVKP